MGDQKTDVFVDYHQFTISSGGPFDEPFLAPNSCLVYHPSRTRVRVTSGVATGPVTVTLQALLAAPPAVDESWQDIAEVSIVAVDDEPLEVGGWDYRRPDEPRLDAAGPGTYRLRIHANGRDTHYDESVLEPVEEYLIQAWPAPYAPPVTLRATSEVAHMEETQEG